MATGQVKTVEVLPSREIGKIQVVDPLSRSIVIEDTIDNVVIHMQAHFGMTEKQARELVQRGRELRGIQKGVGYVERFDAQPV